MRGFDKFSMGFAATLAAVGFFALGAWTVMVLTGILHSFYPLVPAFGFWTCAVVCLIVRLMFGNGPATRS